MSYFTDLVASQATWRDRLRCWAFGHFAPKGWCHRCGVELPSEAEQSAGAEANFTAPLSSLTRQVHDDAEAARRAIAKRLPNGHCLHAPKCIGKGASDERDPLGCCNCGTREYERKATP